MWDEEREHLDIMEKLAAKHNVPHTAFSPIFAAAAYALGIGTALLGKEGAMACTVAVEEVHKDLLETLTKLRDDELHHYDTGVQYDGMKAPMYNALKWVIQTGCKGAISIAERI
ncbi:unnamed protein product [Strongylus vulgaris]|uniref:Ubiquinone biosynthesis protein COQ7 n=1 Tax=Strongylus vulgaris TaxID=40348 RepID=A0A3P7JPW5_STRVU|nr:unnamed protein product [Strongylus vulgaris]